MTNFAFYGLITSVATFLYTCLLFALGYHGEKLEQGQMLGYFSMLIWAACLAWGMLATRKEAAEESQSFGYGKAYKSGLAINFFAALGNGLFTYIYYGFVNPGMVDVIVALQEKKAKEMGQPQEVIDQMAGFMNIFMQPWVQGVIAALATVLIGFLLVAIVALFVKGKKDPDPVASIG